MWVYVNIYICIYMHTCLHMYTCIYVYVYSVYINKYTCIHLYVYIYIYILSKCDQIPGLEGNGDMADPKSYNDSSKAVSQQQGQRMLCAWTKQCFYAYDTLGLEPNRPVDQHHCTNPNLTVHSALKIPPVQRHSHHDTGWGWVL